MAGVMHSVPRLLPTEAGAQFGLQGPEEQRQGSEAESWEAGQLGASRLIGRPRLAEGLSFTQCPHPDFLGPSSQPALR